MELIEVHKDGAIKRVLPGEVGFMKEHGWKAKEEKAKSQTKQEKAKPQTKEQKPEPVNDPEEKNPAPKVDGPVITKDKIKKA